MAPALNNMRPSVKNMINGQYTSDTIHFEISINYNINALTKANAQDSKAHPISIFRHMEFLKIDTKNIFTSLLYIADFIRTRKV